MSLKMTGFDELKRVLMTYEKKTAKAALRKAVRAGTAVLKSAIKSEVPVDEGKLRKATDAKVTSRGVTAGGIVGADVDDLKQDHEADRDRPTNIDHLVNYGHVTADGRFVPPSGYMQRGAAKGMPAAEAKMESVLRASIEAMEDA